MNARALWNKQMNCLKCFCVSTFRCERKAWAYIRCCTITNEIIYNDNGNYRKIKIICDMRMKYHMWNKLKYSHRNVKIISRFIQSSFSPCFMGSWQIVKNSNLSMEMRLFSRFVEDTFSNKKKTKCFLWYCRHSCLFV